MISLQVPRLLTLDCFLLPNQEQFFLSLLIQWKQAVHRNYWEFRWHSSKDQYIQHENESWIVSIAPNHFKIWWNTKEMSQLIVKHHYKNFFFYFFIFYFIFLERQIKSYKNAILKILYPRIQLKTMPHEVEVTGSTLLLLTP